MKAIFKVLTISLLASFLTSCGYNSMVEKDENVKAKWGQVQNQYQRRADLIPNLVKTVKGAAAHEKDVLVAVTEARSKATAINVDPSKLTPEAIKNFQKAQDGLSSALSRLLVVIEKYPDLKTNQNFLNLQVQLEGTENRITTERMRFNEAVQGYNSYIRKVPQIIVANITGFEQKGYFESKPGAEEVPDVEF